MTDYPAGHVVEPNDKLRLGSSSRQHSIEQQAPLKAVAIGQTHQLAEPKHACGQMSFGVAITPPCRRTPYPAREPSQRDQVLEDPQQQICWKKPADDQAVLKSIRCSLDHGY